MSARQGSVGARAPTHTLRWISLGALGAGALLGIFQPLVMVAVGGFGIAAGPSWVGLLFMLCVALLLIVGVIAMVSGGSRGTTVPILAVSGMLALGLIGGNMTASALDIGFAQPRAEPSFVPADPDGPEWTRSGSMLEARHGHTATLLPDGRVLVAGGYTTSWSVMASAELYDPITGRWSATGSLHVPAAEHVAVLLDGGGVLVVSTVPGQHDAEVWSPGTGTWEAVDEMAAPHGRGLTATALADSRVLVTGGFTTADEPLATAEIYDPGSDTWTTTAPMGTPRHGHTATLLADGRVLVVGGMSAGSMQLASAELYDPLGETWTGAASMQAGRINHAAVTLDDQRVLVFGGAAAFPMPPVEAFDVAAGEWRAAGTLEMSDIGATKAVAAGSGKVLVMGWGSEYELYNPRAPRVQDPPSGQAAHGNGYTVTRLSDGEVLVVGGLVPVPSDGSGWPPTYVALATAHMFDATAVR